MTVIAMSRTEIDRMSVLRDLAADRIKVADAATLMGLCACRKSNPDIFVMQSAEDWTAKNTPCSLNGPR